MDTEHTIYVDTLPYIRVDTPPLKNTPVLLEAVNKAGETPKASLSKRVSSQMRLYSPRPAHGRQEKEKFEKRVHSFEMLEHWRYVGMMRRSGILVSKCTTRGHTFCVAASQDAVLWLHILDAWPAVEF